MCLGSGAGRTGRLSLMFKRTFSQTIVPKLSSTSTMRPPTVALFFALLTVASAFPSPSFSSHRQKSDVKSSSIIVRQDNASATPPTITITNTLPEVRCLAAAHDQSYTSANIQKTINVFAQYLSPNFPGPFSPDQTDLAHASTGIDPAIPSTYAPGCDTTKPMLWTPMGFDMGDLTDIIVMNVDDVAHTAAFCAIMTNADEPVEGKAKYHVCNPQ
ncbi:MAG: hypothetical protein Q9170_003291 [Blastenia crenularia]